MAEHRHKRDTDARRKPRAATVAAPLALLATASAVTLGVLASNPAIRAACWPHGRRRHLQRGDVARRHASPAAESRLDRAGAGQLQKAFDRHQRLVGDPGGGAQRRHAAVDHHRPQPLDRLRRGREAGRRDRGRQAGPGHRPQGRRPRRGRRRRPARWVTAGYLSDEKPLAAAAGLSMAPCPDPGVENGLTANAVYVYRSVCHAFPQITSYGGWDGHGEHSSGKALDIMTSDVGARQRDRGLPARRTPPSSSSTTSSGASRSGRRCAPARAGGRSRHVARPPPTTSTTCTSRPTDRSRDPQRSRLGLR